MGRASQDNIHTLTIPTQIGTLIIPSATIAEVLNVPSMTPIPFAPPWVSGVIAWRNTAVSVVSFEALLGTSPLPPVSASKIVVLYPLPGRNRWEFFSIMAVSEPRPQEVNNSAIALPADELPQSPYIAAGLKLRDQPFFIPDFEALRKTFYPQS